MSMGRYSPSSKGPAPFWIVYNENGLSSCVKYLTCEEADKSVRLSALRYPEEEFVMMRSILSAKAQTEPTVNFTPYN